VGEKRSAMEVHPSSQPIMVICVLVGKPPDLCQFGAKRSPWFLAIGVVLHGLAWDSWHYGNSTYIPDWYAIACFAVDLALGTYVAARVPAYQRASRLI
jgi:hypothetical protein